MTKNKGFTLIEAMIGMAVFAIGISAVLLLVVHSFKANRTVWDGHVSQMISVRMYNELYYRVKTSSSDKIEVGIIKTYSSDNFPCAMDTKWDLGCCRVIVGHSAEVDKVDEDVFPVIFVPGFNFFPTQNYLACWKVLRITSYSLNNELKGNSFYQFRNDEKGMTATYNFQTCLLYNYDPQSETPPRRKSCNVFALGVY